MNKLVYIAAAIVAAMAAPSYAARFDIAYSSAETGDFSAVLEGALSSDGKIFNVSGVDSFLLDGSARSNVHVMTADYNLGGSYGPSVALNGSFIDLYFTDPYYLAVIAVGDIQAANLKAYTSITTGGVGSEGNRTFIAFVAADYSGQLEASAAVPEPAAWAMLVGGFGLVGAAMRRKVKVSFVLATG